VKVNWIFFLRHFIFCARCFAGDDSIEGLIAAELYALLQHDHANNVGKGEKGKKRKKVQDRVLRPLKLHPPTETPLLPSFLLHL
jgi:hypothetical protein